MRAIILASTSMTRRHLLENAGVDFEVVPSRVDEESIKDALRAEGVSARDIADALAEGKARKVAAKRGDALVIGADQTAELDGTLLSKPIDRGAAINQLRRLSGQTHRLHSAVVLYDQGRPVWRHVSTVRLSMRPFGNSYIESYLDRTWPAISGCVGGYMLEGEGVRLFTHIDGDYFAVLGLPLVELCNYLTMIGVIDG